MKKTSVKTEEEVQKTILHRLSRIEGQLKGIRRMVEQKNQCLDVITQIMAVRSAMSMLGIELLKEDVLCKKDGSRKIDEAYVKKLFTLQ